MPTWVQWKLQPIPKKKEKRQSTREMTTGLFMLRCKELGLSVAELEEIDYGLVMDMLIEQGNDEHDYPSKATQEDFNRF